LTTHDSNFFADPVPLHWEEEDPEKRGPVVATTSHPMQRNAIGAHSGSYCIYKALAVACGKLDPNYLPKLHMTRPVFDLGPFKAWGDRTKIATMDPWGHLVTDVSIYCKVLLQAKCSAGSWRLYIYYAMPHCTTWVGLRSDLLQRQCVLSKCTLQLNHVALANCVHLASMASISNQLYSALVANTCRSLERTSARATTSGQQLQ
jgi:GTP cyclohydrolase N terminal